MQEWRPLRSQGLHLSAQGARVNRVVLDPDDPTRAIIGSHSEPFFGAAAGVAILENIHRAEKCDGRVCVIHNPTEHAMSEWELHWRDDRGIFERLCPEHGVGHPDPDQFDYWRATGQIEQAIHGCCMCG